MICRGWQWLFGRGQAYWWLCENIRCRFLVLVFGQTFLLYGCSNVRVVLTYDEIKIVIAVPASRIDEVQLFLVWRFIATFHIRVVV